MSTKDDEFLRRLRVAFKSEAGERLTAISSGLLQLEGPSDGQPEAILEGIFREAHSLKGAARAVNMTEVEAVCQALESAFSSIKKGEIQTSTTTLDVIYDAVELLKEIISAPAEKPAVLEPKRQEEVLARLSQLKASDSPAAPIPPPLSKEPAPPDAPPGSPSPQPAVVVSPAAPSEAASQEETAPPAPPVPGRGAPLSETVRIATAKLDSLFLQVQEMLALKLTARQRVSDLRELSELVESWNRETANASAGLSNPSHQAYSAPLETRLKRLVKMAEQDYRSLSGMVDHLLADMKKVLLLPVSSLLETLPMMVRELSRDQGKEVELLLKGGEIEMDRRILEEMKDPLIHLLRNSIDHGIEPPEERLRRQKPRRAAIRVQVAQMASNRVEMTISDDGAGIDLARVREVALQRGLPGGQDPGKLTDQEALMLIFQSDISTSPIITNLSGRGLGLAIVRERVEKLGGHIAVTSTLHVGTVFRILLPVTLATFRGILVRCGERFFVVPTANVDRVLRVRPRDVVTVENRETIALGTQRVSLVGLDAVLELPSAVVERKPEEQIPILVVVSGDKRVGFRVDEIVNEQEVLLKPLGHQLARIRNIAGATVLGSGAVVPILHPADLIKSAVTAAPTGSFGVERREAREEKGRILVAEDSITSRTLLKNILEGAGYQVRVAVDGADALALLKTEPIDLVVSDIEMPRMNGFDLTARIRADSRLSQLPVILVTGLESREDREHGIEVGANAYLIKSSFDQSNLLDIIERLI